MTIKIRKLTKEDNEVIAQGLQSGDFIDLFGAPQTPWYWMKWGFEVHRPIDGFVEAFYTFLWWEPKTIFGKLFHKTFPKVKDWAANKSADNM